MNVKSGRYWFVFHIVAALSAAAIWYFAPQAPIPRSTRALFVKWTHKALQQIGIESRPDDKNASSLPPSKNTTPDKASNAGKEAKAEKVEKAEKSDDAFTMTPAQRKKKYDELTKKLEARRIQVLRENLNRSPEGKRALAAVKAFKELGAKVEELKKRYGETDSRVMARRGDLLKLKDEVRRTNEEYKKWKEKHPDKLMKPEDDEIYRKIFGERRLYKN